MPISDMLTPEGQTRGVDPLPFNPQGFGNVYAASVYDDFYNLPVGLSGGDLDTDQQFTDRQKLLEQNFGTRFTADLNAEAEKQAPTSVLGFSSSPDTAAQTNEIARRADFVRGKLNEAITAGREQNPQQWAGIKTDDEIHAEILQRSKRTREISSNITVAGDSRLARYGAPLAAGLVTTPLDPINLATMPLGAGAGMSLLRAVGSEALVNMGVEAVELPAISANEKRLGQPYTAGDALLDVGTAGLAAGAITGALHAGRGIDHIIGNLRNKALDKILENPETPGEVRSAAQYLYRTNQIDEAVEPSIRENLGIVDDAEARLQEKSINRLNAQEALDAFENYREPKFEGVSDKTSLDNGGVIGAMDRVVGGLEDPLAPPTGMRAAEPERIFPERFDVGGLAGWATPKPIASPGGLLYRETKVRFDGEKDLLTAIRAAKNGQQHTLFVSNNRDLAIGQGDNKGVLITFRADRLSGAENKKPGTGDLAGREYKTDYVGKGAIQEIEISKTALEAEGVASANLLARGGALMELNKALKQDFSLVRDTGDSLIYRPKETAAVPLPASSNAAEADLLFRPNDALSSMRADIEAADTASPAFSADFQRLLAEQPDLKIPTENGEMSIKDVAEIIKQNENELQAIRTCAIGGEKK